MPYRAFTPPEPDPPELEEPYVAVLRAQRRRARLTTCLALAAAFAVGTAKAASVRGSARATAEASRAQQVRERVARREAAHQAIGRATERAHAAQARFDRTVHAALAAGMRPRPELGACPVELPIARLPVWGKSAFPLLVVSSDEARGVLPSQSVAEILGDVRRAEQHLDAGRYEEAVLYADALERPERLTREVVVTSAPESRPPEVVSGAAFQPGAVVGSVYLYDFAADAVVCAGSLDARSSGSVGYVYADQLDAPARLSARASMADAIAEDLRVQVEKAAREGLRFRSGT
ncbi:MAG: hypothetical protein JWP97_2143 [Labilithrix sp.]|nr:hypothetical protein [Labilithrix sp.]